MEKWGLHAEGTASREHIRLHHFSGSSHSAQIVRSYCAHCSNIYIANIAQLERNQQAHSVFICFCRPVNSSSTKLISISISCVLFVLPTKYCFSNWEWGQTQLTLFKRSKHPKVFPYFFYIDTIIHYPQQQDILLLTSCLSQGPQSCHLQWIFIALAAACSTLKTSPPSSPPPSPTIDPPSP